jgi:hypothetical protein
LSAQENAPQKECTKVTSSFKMMSEGTKINHKNLTMLVGILNDPARNKEERANARKALQEMNAKTADRANNSQYPEIFKEMRQAYIVNCGNFTEENNSTISGLIERSVDFNTILAKVLGDDLSQSKIK